MARRLFISYNHRDADMLGELRDHLRPLERSGAIAPWFDRYLVPGDDFDREVRKALAAADFIGLLVTPRFLASDYCVDVEMQDAVARHNEGRARVVPIIAAPCGWKSTYLSKLLATPTDGTPISKWPNKDEAWNIVAEDLAKAAIASQGGERAQPYNLPRAPADSPPQLRSPSQAQVPATSPVKGEPRPVSPFSIPRSTRPTDQEIDDFRLEAFETISQLFESSVRALEGQFTGRFRRLDANRFTVTLYRNGTKVAGCTVYTGGSFFGGRGISYAGTDSGETNTMSEELAAELSDEGLCLTPVMGQAFGRGAKAHLSAEEGAAYLWNTLTERLKL